MFEHQKHPISYGLGSDSVIGLSTAQSQNDKIRLILQKKRNDTITNYSKIKFSRGHTKSACHIMKY